MDPPLDASLSSVTAADGKVVALRKSSLEAAANAASLNTGIPSFGLPATYTYESLPYPA
jgi:hypothetical protein